MDGFCSRDFTPYRLEHRFDDFCGQLCSASSVDPAKTNAGHRDHSKHYHRGLSDGFGAATYPSF